MACICNKIISPWNNTGGTVVKVSPTWEFRNIFLVQGYGSCQQMYLLQTIHSSFTVCIIRLD